MSAEHLGFHRVTFTLADEFVTQVSVIHMNEHTPFRKRTVTIDLTPEQMERIAPRFVGQHNGHDVYEVVHDCHIEWDPPEVPDAG